MSSPNQKYALSITMKYGEILHIEGISQDEKNSYFALAKSDSSMIIEDRNTIRNIKGSDIATITSVNYDSTYQNVIHPLRKMCLSESSLGLSIFKLLSRLFILLVVVFVVSAIASEFVDGTLMTTAFSPADTYKMILTSIQKTDSIFRGFFVFMLVASLGDMLFGLTKPFYINQDGSPQVQCPRYLTLVYSIGFFVVYNVLLMILSGISI